MNVSLLFRKRSPLKEEDMPWISGAETHSWTAKRNATGEASVSAILVRALVCALEGNVTEAAIWAKGAAVAVTSRSTPGAVGQCAVEWGRGKCFIPHGAPDKVTYHVGVLAIVDALGFPDQSADFLTAYYDLLAQYRQHGKHLAIKEALCRAADELYYWLRYGGGEVDPDDDRVGNVEVCASLMTAEMASVVGRATSLDVTPLTDLEAMRRKIGMKAETPAQVAAAPMKAGGFVGWQAAAMRNALVCGENVLLAGPTGTGKTYATQQAVLESGADLVVCEGKEGLMDLDFLGAILPQADGSRQWVDGPILRALRLAQFDPTVLFLDEINRIPRQHLNLLLGLMNPKSREVCEAQGLAVAGDGPFYVLEVPMTSEVVWCPTAHLRFVAAGNFGRAYQVYDLDPAVRRRFDTVIEFDYLNYEDELALVRREFPGLLAKVSEALVKMAHETRRLMGNGELPGCIDTASLLNWARKCARYGSGTVSSVMAQASLTWGDLVCGRNHMGKVNSGSFQALQDYLVSMALLPDDTGTAKVAAPVFSAPVSRR